MSTFNLSVSDRRFTKFEIEESSSQVNINGEYTFTLENSGLLPSNTLSINVSELVLTDSDSKIISDRTKNIGRIKGMSNEDITFEFEFSSATSEMSSLVDSVCNGDSINASIDSTISGIILTIDTSSEGSYPVMSYNCDLGDNEDQPEEPVSEPEPPEDPQSDAPDGPPDNSDDEEIDQPEDDSPIQGPNIVSVGETSRYEWNTYPDETESFDWVTLAETSDIESSDVTLELANQEVESLSLDFTCEVQGDFLIVISAIANGEVIEQPQKVVSVVP